MGRGKIEIKRIENSTNRQVTYTKRRNGLLKKANEITVLCDAKVSVVIFSNSNKMHDYCSPNTSLPKQLESYQKISKTKLWDAKHENLSNEIERTKKENDSMQIELRHLNGEDVTSLHFPELASLEAAIDSGLRKVRNRKMEELEKIAQRDQMLEDENKRLSYILQQQEMGMSVEYQQQQLPFAFRVQPNQPNLHERMLT